MLKLLKLINFRDQNELYKILQHLEDQNIKFYRQSGSNISRVEKLFNPKSDSLSNYYLMVISFASNNYLFLYCRKGRSLGEIIKELSIHSPTLVNEVGWDVSETKIYQSGEYEKTYCN